VAASALNHPNILTPHLAGEGLSDNQPILKEWLRWREPVLLLPKAIPLALLISGLLRQSFTSDAVISQRRIR
jgi:hypothetical protein